MNSTKQISLLATAVALAFGCSELSTRARVANAGLFDSDSNSAINSATVAQIPSPSPGAPGTPLETLPGSPDSGRTLPSPLNPTPNPIPTASPDVPSPGNSGLGSPAKQKPAAPRPTNPGDRSPGTTVPAPPSGDTPTLPSSQ